jgi:hypothetical protein
LSSTLKVPTASSERVVVNGAIYLSAVPVQARVSYAGPDVQQDYLATDGSTVIYSLLSTSYAVVSPSGLISASPSEPFTNSALGRITNAINGQPLYKPQANWQAGAAYVKVVRQTLGDELYTYDCASPTTTGNNPTPCSATISTLENYFPYASTADGKTYQLSDGQIVTLQGVRAWVANSALGGATTDYRVYYQYNGGIHAGYVIKSGTPQDDYYVLNRTAVQSIESAINF